MKSSKDNTISVIRLIALMMIISCHILQGLGNFWAFWINVGVQIFFFISGYLYGKKDIKDVELFYKERLKKILIPNAILVLIILFVDYYFFGIKYSKIKMFGNIIGLGGFIGNIANLSHTWFISYILFCYLLTPVFNCFFKKKGNNFLRLLFLITIIQLLDYYGIVAPNSPWICNYLIGYYYSKCCTEKKSKNFFDYGIIILTLVLFPMKVSIMYGYNDRLPYIVLLFKNIINDWCHVLIGCSLFIILYRTINHIKIKNNNFLTFCDKYSYYIYLVHQIVILGNMSLLKLTPHLIFNIIIIVILSIIMGIALYWTSKLLINFIKKITDIIYEGKRKEVI